MLAWFPFYRHVSGGFVFVSLDALLTGSCSLGVEVGVYLVGIIDLRFFSP